MEASKRLSDQEVSVKQNVEVYDKLPIKTTGATVQSSFKV